MTPTEVAAKLRAFNEWRRGGDIEYPGPLAVIHRPRLEGGIWYVGSGMEGGKASRGTITARAERAGWVEAMRRAYSLGVKS